MRIQLGWTGFSPGFGFVVIGDPALAMIMLWNVKRSGRTIS